MIRPTGKSLRHIMLEAAGVPQDGKPQPNPEFELVLKFLSLIQAHKEAEYGDYVSQQKGEPDRVAIFDHFVNLRRKFRRAENQVMKILDKEADPSCLVDTYSDMAVYAALGILLAFERMKVDG